MKITVARSDIKDLDLAKKVLIFLLALFLINTLLWITILPFNRNPDEATHFSVAKYIFENKRLPVYGVGQFKPVIYKQSQSQLSIPYSPYASIPGLNYIISAFFMLLASPFLKTNQLFFAARLTSLFSGIAVVYLAFKIAELIFPNRSSLKFIVPAFIAFLPQFTFVSAYVNNDSFGVFVSSLFLYLLLKGEKKGWPNKNIIFLGISMGLVLLAKYNAYVILALGVLYLLFSQARRRPRLAFKVFFMSFAIAIIFSGWWFIRNYILYKDIFGIAVQKEAVMKIYPQYRTLADKGLTHLRVLTETNWFSATDKSFFAAFGYVNLLIPGWTYYFFRLFLIVSALGVLLYMIRSKDKKNVKLFIFLSLIVIASAIFSIHISLTSFFSPQGRYLFPAIIPFSLILCLGITNVFRKESLRKSLIIIFFLFLIYANIISLLGAIVPRYYTNFDFANVNEAFKGIEMKPKQNLTEVFKVNYDKLDKIMFFYNAGKKNSGFLIIKSGYFPGGNEREISIRIDKNTKDIYNYYGIRNNLNLSSNKKVYLSVTALTKRPVLVAAATEAFPYGKAFIDKRPIKDNISINLKYNSNSELLSIRELYRRAPILINIRFWLLILDFIILIALIFCYCLWLFRSDWETASSGS